VTALRGLQNGLYVAAGCCCLRPESLLDRTYSARRTICSVDRLTFVFLSLALSFVHLHYNNFGLGSLTAVFDCSRALRVLRLKRNGVQ
jgi:hypothetical protein